MRTWAFRIVGEAGLEHVLDVVGEGGYDAVDAARSEEHSGAGGVEREDVSGPIEEAVAVR